MNYEFEIVYDHETSADGLAGYAIAEMDGRFWLYRYEFKRSGQIYSLRENSSARQNGRGIEYVGDPYKTLIAAKRALKRYI